MVTEGALVSQQLGPSLVAVGLGVHRWYAAVTGAATSRHVSQPFTRALFHPWHGMASRSGAIRVRRCGVPSPARPPNSCSSGEEDPFERQRGEFVAVGLVKLVLELNPVEAQGMEKTLQDIHHDQHRKGDRGEDRVAADDRDLITYDRWLRGRLLRCSAAERRPKQCLKNIEQSARRQLFKCGVIWHDELPDCPC